MEPMAGDKLKDNLNPVGRIYYAGSTMGCVPTSMSQEVGAALGAQAGEAKLREVITAGGVASVRRGTETPFNMSLEARPRRRSYRSAGDAGSVKTSLEAQVAGPEPDSNIKLVRTNLTPQQ